MEAENIRRQRDDLAAQIAVIDRQNETMRGILEQLRVITSGRTQYIHVRTIQKLLEAAPAFDE